jgi:hypothetical protein
VLYARTNILLKLSEEVAERRKIVYAHSVRVYCPTRKENATLNIETKEEDQTKERNRVEDIGVEFT